MTKKTSKKKCPGYQFFIKPTLDALYQLGGSGANSEIYKTVIKNTNLPEEIIDEMHSFTMTEVEYKLMWARTYLKNYGAIENSKQGVWVLTTKGAAMVKQDDLEVKEIIRFTSNKNSLSKKQEIDTDPSSETKNWREQITDILLNMSPYAFERLAQRLLRECGFSDVDVTKKSGDGGIDGIGKLRINGIFSFNVAF